MSTTICGACEREWPTNRGPICPECGNDGDIETHVVRCNRCDGDGWIDTCRADGEDCRRETCPVCEGWSAEDERERHEAAYAAHIDRQIDRMQEGDL